MAVEAGAKTGIFEVDDVAMEYLKEHGREPKAVYHSDPDAHYVREYTFDLSKVEPVVAKPDFVDNLAPAKDVRGIKIDEAFLGSCNNGRIEDLRVGAQVIKGKKVSEKVRFLVVPASQTHLLLTASMDVAGIGRCTALMISPSVIVSQRQMIFPNAGFFSTNFALSS